MMLPSWSVVSCGGPFLNAVYPLVITYPYKFADDVPVTQQAQVILAVMYQSQRFDVLLLKVNRL